MQGVRVFRSIVLALAAFLMMGQARERPAVSEPASERDGVNRADTFQDYGLRSSRRKGDRHGPVSEL